MSGKNRRLLADRVAEAAQAVLAAKQNVSAVDVLVGIGWLDFGTVRRWQQGQIDCLETGIQTGTPRILEAMELFRGWAAGQNLHASETTYVARTPARQALRFSRSSDPAIELAYRTHWVSPALSEKKRERLAEQASRAPELVVVQPLKADWTCHRCSSSGSLLMLENNGPACLACVGLADLEFLPPGDALLTRRAKAKSQRHAVVVKFSRSRRRYERQGLLVEPEALQAARRELDEQRARRTTRLE
jgi:hypothetical protein